MKRSTLFMLLTPLVVSIAVSCKQGDKNGAMIPADAGVVVHINSPSLTSKLSWKEIQQTNWFKEMYTEASDSLAKKLMDDPENSGIDPKADMVLFVKRQNQGGYMAFQGSVKDADAFEAFNKNISKGAVTATEGDFSSIVIENKAVVTWNDKHFVYVMDAPMGGASEYMLEGDGAQQSSSFPPDSLRKFGKSLFILDNENSLGENKRFSTLLKEDGDIHLWINTENLSGGLGAGMLSMMRLNVLLEGNVSATTVNFGDGKITMKSRQYYGKEMTDLIEKYSPKPISDDIVNRIPTQDVAAAFVMNYPPEGLKEFIKLIGVDGMVNGFLGKAGYSVDEFIKANKGEIIVAFSDFKMENKTMTVPNEYGEPYTYSTNTPDIKFLFCASIRDKAAFDKLISTINSQLPAEASEQLSSKFNYKVNNNWFAASNSPEYVDKFLAGTNNKVPFADKISGHPFGGYIDIQKLLAATSSGITDSSAKDAINASIKLWQNVVFHGGEVKDGAMISEGEINLMDKNTNSLKQLNQYLDVLSKSYKSKQRAISFDSALPGNTDASTPVED